MKVKIGQMALVTLAVLPLLLGGALLAVRAQSSVEGMSQVTKDFNVNDMMTSATDTAIQNAKEIARWFKEMGKDAKDANDRMGKQVANYETAKKSEIDALDARYKAARSAKDEAQQTAIKRALEEQKLELDIIEAIDKFSAQRADMARQWNSTGEAIDKLVSAMESAQRGGGDVERDHQRAVEKAREAGLPEPTRAINYKVNEDVLKQYGSVGREFEKLGREMQSMAQSREKILSSWQKHAKAIAAK